MEQYYEMKTPDGRFLQIVSETERLEFEADPMYRNKYKFVPVQEGSFIPKQGESVDEKPKKRVAKPPTDVKDFQSKHG